MAITRLLDDTPDADAVTPWPRCRGLGRDAAVELTPMIDVTFLLLIFFMVTATLAAQQDVAVPEAVYGVGVDPSAATVITLLEGEGDTELEVILGDGDGPRGDEAAMRQWVEQGMAEGRTVVVVKAEGRVLNGRTRRVYQALSGIEGVTLHIGVRDKP